MYKQLFLFSILILIFISCQNRPLQQLGATSISQKIDKYALEGGDNVIVDILFVVDNSGSMKEEQEKVAQNIVNFMKMLKKSADDGKTSYHIGVITTSMWDKAQTQSEDVKNKEDGRLLLIKSSYSERIVPDPTEQQPDRTKIVLDCDTVNTTKRYLENTDNDSVVDLLKYTIKCTGTDGSGIERGLDAMKKALSPGRLDAENRGFLRPEAKLMVIVIGDEDDCSTGIRAYDPATGLPIEDDPSFTNFPIAKTRGKDCIEQHDSIPAATEVITDRSAPEQNKLKPVSEYFDFLVNLKGGDYTKVGFATIVGPLNCWTGEINDMGQGPQSQSSSIPFAYQNCSYSSSQLSPQMFDLNYNTCRDNVLPACSCTNDVNDPTHCNTTSDLYTTCFNNAAGIPNRIPIISENSCSEAYLNGKCDEGKHCEVTEKGVKCVENTCSAENTNGTCPANQYCDNGVCSDKQPATYAEKDSYATPGRRFLEMEKLVEAKNVKDSYKYSICLEDFGTPLSLIGARLADSKCEYRLINRTDTPCSIVINIFEPSDKNLEHGKTTSLNSPWTYTTTPENADKTGEELYKICKENLDKPFSERIDISDYLEKVPCGKNGDGEKECLKILFPQESGECPQPGSNVEIYYGVIE